jgi:hypothetical protein
MKQNAKIVFIFLQKKKGKKHYMSGQLAGKERRPNTTETFYGEPRPSLCRPDSGRGPGFWCRLTWLSLARGGLSYFAQAFNLIFRILN